MNQMKSFRYYAQFIMSSLDVIWNLNDGIDWSVQRVKKKTQDM